MTSAIKVLIAQVNPTIGDIAGNQKKLLAAIEQGKALGADIVLTSEMALTGYPPEDFVLLASFVEAVEEALAPIIKASIGIGVIVGTLRKNPSQTEKPLFNTAAICFDGRLLGFQDKILLPTYDVFDERRYFEPGKSSSRWQIGSHMVGVTICEDIWQHSRLIQGTSYAKDPIRMLENEPLDLLANLSASPFYSGKTSSRLQACSNAAKTLQCPVVLCNQIGGNDSLIFDGHSLLVNSKGELTALAKGFSEDLPLFDTSKIEQVAFPQDTMKDLHDALVLGVRDYFVKSGFKKACIGLSGGIDSALVASIAVAALGKEHVFGVAMPSRYSSEGSLKDAEALSKNLAISLQTIPIEGPLASYLDLLTPHFEGKALAATFANSSQDSTERGKSRSKRMRSDEEGMAQPCSIKEDRAGVATAGRIPGELAKVAVNTTEENLQARIRGMILMALSNKMGYIVLSTGNKSELAMGYSTLYGDMCGGLAVISDLTKEQVYALSRFINRDKEIIPESTMTKPPSAELRPGQKDTDSLPQYPIVDAVLKAYIEEGKPAEEIAAQNGLELDLVLSLIKKIHANEYKRRQSPPGLKVTEKAFSIGRRFPIVQGWV
jgi:NAD+ synthase (glutamine-hydrolysing)